MHAEVNHFQSRSGHGVKTDRSDTIFATRQPLGNPIARWSGVEYIMFHDTCGHSIDLRSRSRRYNSIPHRNPGLVLPRPQPL